MASRGAIAGIRDEAVSRLMKAAGRIASHTDVAAPVLPEFRDLDYRNAMQLDALATWAENLCAVLVPTEVVAATPAALGYEEMTVDALKAMAEARGINLTKNMKKADIISVLQHFDTSAEQPPEDDVPPATDETPANEPVQPEVESE